VYEGVIEALKVANPQDGVSMEVKHQLITNAIDVLTKSARNGGRSGFRKSAPPHSPPLRPSGQWHHLEPTTGRRHSPRPAVILLDRVNKFIDISIISYRRQIAVAAKMHG
jgi:hypothetical protein